MMKPHFLLAANYTCIDYLTCETWKIEVDIKYYDLTNCYICYITLTKNSYVLRIMLYEMDKSNFCNILG